MIQHPPRGFLRLAGISTAVSVFGTKPDFAVTPQSLA
jgi:hypothetical protein